MYFESWNFLQVSITNYLKQIWMKIQRKIKNIVVIDRVSHFNDNFFVIYTEHAYSPYLQWQRDLKMPISVLIRRFAGEKHKFFWRNKYKNQLVFFYERYSFLKCMYIHCTRLYCSMVLVPPQTIAHSHIINETKRDERTNERTTDSVKYLLLQWQIERIKHANVVSTCD